MANEELWLPTATATATDFLFEETTAENQRINEPESSDEDESITGLTWKMAHSSLCEHGIINQKAMANSPESTLCGLGGWSFSSNSCSPDDGPSQVSSPPSTPSGHKKDDALDLLSAAAGRVVRLGLTEDRGILGPPMDPNRHPDLLRQQLHAAQFHQLKREQMLKQQLALAWRSQSAGARSGGGGRTTGISPSTWSPGQKPHHHHRPKPGGSGMTAVFLSGSGARRESTGTGVFLPRSIGAPNEPPTCSRKKPACSTVLLPARVVQALNLNLDEIGVHSRVTGEQGRFEADDYERRIKMFHLQQQPQKRSSNIVSQQPPSSGSSGSGSHEIQLPQEWTY